MCGLLVCLLAYMFATMVVYSSLSTVRLYCLFARFVCSSVSICVLMCAWFCLFVCLLVKLNVLLVCVVRLRGVFVLFACLCDCLCVLV